jgi:hypothetical protein
MGQFGRASVLDKTIQMGYYYVRYHLYCSGMSCKSLCGVKNICNNNVRLILFSGKFFIGTITTFFYSYGVFCWIYVILLIIEAQKYVLGIS